MTGEPALLSQIMVKGRKVKCFVICLFLFIMMHVVVLKDKVGNILSLFYFFFLNGQQIP